FSDRDFVSRVQMHTARQGNEIIFQYRSVDDPAAPRTAYIRGEVINMKFILTSAAGSTRTKVDAEFLCDPKGWIPSILVNLFIRDWPKTTFRNLRKEIMKPGIAADPRFSLPAGESANDQN
ncbi:MAG TPA: hypothetical protein VK654_15740, partial [Nitrospirota bacterium]|nr:hypothetical protein [Nitrospirota bacterium]